MRWVALVGALAVVGSLGLAGCDGEDHKNQAPVARISASPLSGPTPLVVTLDASASTDKEDKIESYTWVTGDGMTLAGAVVTHTYDRPGEFTVTLTVMDHKGKTSTASQVVTVENRPPVAAFKPYQAEGFAGAVMRFDASASIDPDGEITAMEWDLGDGSWATGPVVEHRYAVAGDYEVLLRVRDELGGESDAVQGVSVEPEEEYPAYRVEYLDCDNCLATHISNSGTIVLRFQYPNEFNGAQYLYKEGVLTALVGPNGYRGRVIDMNEKGQMTGSFEIPQWGTSQDEIFIFDGTTWTMVPQPKDAEFFYPVAINERGEVVAAVHVGGQDWFSYPCVVKQGRCEQIFVPGRWADAIDINDDGHILGLSGNADTAELDAWIYRDGDVEILPLDVLGLFDLKAINNSDQVLLAGSMYGYSWHPLLYSDGHLVELDGLSGWNHDVSVLTDTGWVLGYSKEADGTYRGFRWKDGLAEYLSALGTYSWGSRINESGDVFGYIDGCHPCVKTRAGQLRRVPAAQYPYAPEPHAPVYESVDMNDLGELVFGQAYRIDDHGIGVPPYYSHRATPVSLLIARLLESNDDISAARGLASIITAAQVAHEDMDLPASCELLYEYDDGVRALTPSDMTQEQADLLRAQTAAIEETLRCP